MTGDRLPALDAITQVREAYATGQVVGYPRRYVTKTGRHTMVVVAATDEFVIGSPVSEVERFQGPTGKPEIRQRRRIGRVSAMAAHEVTVAQFQKFRSDYAFNRTFSRQLDAPANVATWYDAAAFCNWLSQQEGLPPDEWCYDPDQPFTEGMTLYPDYLRRTGYRLPSEAEWEYACRPDATTARYYRETIVSFTRTG